MGPSVALRQREKWNKTLGVTADSNPGQTFSVGDEKTLLGLSQGAGGGHHSMSKQICPFRGRKEAEFESEEEGEE